MTKSHQIYRQRQVKYKKKEKGFTLVEIITVVAIIVMLSGVALIYFGNVNKNTRDSIRVADLTSLYQAISTITQQSSTLGPSVFCVGAGSYPCAGRTYPSSPSTRNVDGTGWVQVNTGMDKTINYHILPQDPINNATYHYTYCANNDDWEIDAVLEADQQQKMTTDGGDDSGKYEIGTNLNLIDKVSGCSF